MEEAAVVFPYKLLVTIISAKNLPVADITTSDPYVAVSIADKPIGRTKTIKRNHLSPEWNEGFYAAVFHKEQTVDLKIWDENLGKDELMGTLSIPLAPLPVNKMCEATYDVVNAGRFTAKATITVALLLGRKERAVKIVPDEEVLARRAQSVARFQARLGDHDVLWPEAYDLVKTTFADFFGDAALRWDAALLRDLLYDVLSVREGERERSFFSGWNYSDECFPRNKLRLVHSTKLSLQDGVFHRFAPIEEHSLQLNLSDDDARFLVLTLPNRFAAWRWFQWLQLAHDLWTDRTRASEVPLWAAVRSIVCTSAVVFSHKTSRPRVRGKLSLSLDHRHELRFDEERVNIKSLRSIVLAADSVLPKRFTLEVEIVRSDAHTSVQEKPHDLATEQAPSADGNAVVVQKGGLRLGRGGLLLSTRRAVGRMHLVGAFKGAASSVSLAAASAAVGVASTAVNAARTIATGNPLNIVKESTDKVVNIASQLSLVPSSVNTMLQPHRSNQFLVVTFQDEDFRMYKEDEQLSFFVEFDTEDIDLRARRAQFTRDKKNNNNVNDKVLSSDGNASIASKASLSSIAPAGLVGVYFPDQFPSKYCLHVFALQGSDGAEKVVRQTRCKVESLLDEAVVKAIKEGDWDALLTLKDKMTVTKELVFNKQIGISLTVDSVEGLIIPEFPSGASKFGGIFAKCKLVSDNGKSGYKAIGSEFRTPTVPLTTTSGARHVEKVPINADFIFFADQLVQRHAFVRIEFCLEDLATHFSLGCAFVPIHFFSCKKEQQYVFPVTRFHASAQVYALAAKLSSSSSSSSSSAVAKMRKASSKMLKEGNNLEREKGSALGEVTVTVKGITETADGPLPAPTASEAEKDEQRLSVRATLRETSLFGASWCAECVSASAARDSECVDIERTQCVPLHDGLQFSQLTFESAADLPPQTQTQAQKEKEKEKEKGKDNKDNDSKKEKDRVKDNEQIPLSLSPLRESSSFSSSISPLSPGSVDESEKDRDRDRESEVDVMQREREERLLRRELCVSVYENQRRSPYPPFAYGTHTLTRARFSNGDFSAALALRAVSAAKLPPCCAWAGDWEVERTHASELDQDGWFYAMSFSRILSQEKRQQKAVSITADAAFVRRRKWIRKLRILPEFSGLLSLAQMQMSEAEREMQKVFETSNAASVSLPISAASSVFDSVGKLARKSSFDLSSVITGAHRDRETDTDTQTETESDNAWRRELSAQCPSAILHSCRERERATGNVLVPWTSVSDVAVVSPSVLSLSIRVDRYFAPSPSTSSAAAERESEGGRGREGSVFRTVELSVFVSHCAAVELKSLIEERCVFSRTRESIRTVQREQNNAFLENENENKNDEVLGENLVGKLENGDFEEEHEREEEDGVDGIPETAQLSLGSELLADLDELSLSLEARIRDLRRVSDAFAKRDKEKVSEKEREGEREREKEVEVLLRRLCRLRLYTAALLALQLTPQHAFRIDELRRMIDTDVARARHIVLQSGEITTANNRIDFLQDMAEKRLRDLALCGAAWRGNGFEESVEVFANDYLVEVAGLLGFYFEGRGQANVKGLSNKLELLYTYLRHNDRLQGVLESALRPYALRAQPRAELSLFLNFGALCSWYKDALRAEMRQRVQDVLSVWRDTEKDVTGQAALFRFPLPWVPQRLSVSPGHDMEHAGPGQGLFCTNIAEDLVEVLMPYLAYARLDMDKVEKVSLELQKQLSALDSAAQPAYINAFLFLAECMRDALQEKKYWEKLSMARHDSTSEEVDPDTEEALAEYAVFLCSVSNDALRVLQRELFVPYVRERAKEREGGQLKKESAPCARAFSRLRLRAADQLSCVLLKCAFLGREQLLRNGLLSAFKQFYADRERHAQSLSLSLSQHDDSTHDNTEDACNSTRKEDFFLDALVQDVQSLLADHAVFLLPANDRVLRKICADKLLVLFLSLIAESRHRGDLPDYEFLQQLCAEGRALRRHLCALLGISEQLGEVVGEKDNSSANNESSSAAPFFATTDYVDEAEHLLDAHAQAQTAVYALDAVLDLLTHGLSGVEVKRAFVRLQTLVTHSRTLAVSLSLCCESVLALRGVKPHFSPAQLQRAKEKEREREKKKRERAQRRRRSFVGGTAAPFSPQSTSAQTSSTPLARRASIQSSNTTQTDAQPVPSPSPVTRRSSIANFFSFASHNTPTQRTQTTQPSTQNVTFQSAVGAVSVRASGSERGARESGDYSLHDNNNNKNNSINAADIRINELVGEGEEEDAAAAADDDDAIEEQEAAESTTNFLLEALRNSASSDRQCFVISNNNNRSEEPETDVSLTEEWIITTNAFDRVFSENVHKARVSLYAHMVQTSLPPAQRDASPGIAESARAQNAYNHTHAFKAIGAWLAKKRENNNTSAQSSRTVSSPAPAKEPIPPNATSKHAETQIQTQTQPQTQVQTQKQQPQSQPQPPTQAQTPAQPKRLPIPPLEKHLAGNIEVDDPQLTMIVNDLRVFHIFPLDFFRTPRPFFVFRINGGGADNASAGAVRCASKDSDDGRADWTEDGPLCIKLSEVSSPLLELQIELYYEGFLSDQVVATASVSFDPRSPHAWVDKEIALSDFSASQKTSQAAERARKEGKPMPLLIATVKMIPGAL